MVFSRSLSYATYIVVVVVLVGLRVAVLSGDRQPDLELKAQFRVFACQARSFAYLGLGACATPPPSGVGELLIEESGADEAKNKKAHRPHVLPQQNASCSVFAWLNCGAMQRPTSANLVQFRSPSNLHMIGGSLEEEAVLVTEVIGR